jgi:hypothetical protein
VSAYLVLAVGILLWALLIHVLVVEPVRLRLRERQAKGTKRAPMPHFRILPRS